MKTRRIGYLNDPKTAVEEAANIVRRGGTVAFPTETVYGLGALGLDPEALRKIFLAKERPRSDPLILHVVEPSWLGRLAAELMPSARALTGALWPGPLTLVVTKSSRVPDLATADLPSVAVRMPSGQVALELMEAVGEPVAAPSANRFGRPSPTTADHVLEDLDGRIDAVLDAGPTEVGMESTVLDIRADPPRILRPGAVTREEIEQELGFSIQSMETGRTCLPSAAVSPGQLDRHYSPRARMHLFSGDEEKMPERMVCAVEKAARGLKVGVLAYENDLPHLQHLPVTLRLLGRRDDPKSCARRLFSALRELDSAGVEAIYARLTIPRGMGQAINDRLLRAASGRTE